jgi:DNA-binding NarL/FixJ family response regulator
MKSHPSILVIDDTPASLGLVCNALRDTGARVLLAESAAAARRVLAHASADLILLDVMMPGEDGYAFCSWLRSQPQLTGLPVLFLTSLDEQEQKLRAFELGAVDYVTKPVHVPELMARVRAQLALLAARRALERKNVELETEVALRLDAENQLASSLDRAVVMLGADGSLLFATRLAHDLAAKYLPNGLAGLAQAQPSIPTDSGTLHIRLFSGTTQERLRMLVLEEEHAPPGPAALMPLGLTPRQAEVAYWVCQGKSNPEIAIILGASHRTIDKHMEGILSRLAVENRASLILHCGPILQPPR